MDKNKFLSFLLAGAALIACLSWAVPATSAEAPGTFSATGSMGTGRRHARSEQLPDGKILIVGGVSTTGINFDCNNNPGNCTFFATAEIYDPVTGTWSPTGSLTTGGRALHDATRLADGRVLVTGGWNGVASLSSAEIYDPTTGLFTATGSMATARSQHTATLLDNGKVLITGGFVSSGPTNSAELYDPATGTFSAPLGSIPSLTDARNTHTATRLPSGKVLIVGGYGNAGELASAELFDPGSESFSATGLLGQGRGSHRATILPNGMVLVTGGNGGNPTDAALSSTEIYDPNANGGVGAFGPAPNLNNARQWHNTVLLPSGEVLIAGGNNDASGHWDVQTNFLSSAELYDPIANTLSSTGSLTTARSMASRIVLWNGRALVAGGGTNTAELYCPEMIGAPEQWAATGSLVTARRGTQASVLDNGKVLISGGTNTAGNPLASAELYDYVTGTFSATGSMGTPRHQHRDALLLTGKILVTGGRSAAASNTLNTAELYDPVAGTFGATGSMGTFRRSHRVVLLTTNGKVLVTGGRGGALTTSNGFLNSAELYDPVAGTFSPTAGSMGTARSNHRTTRLTDGRVLVTGGTTTGGVVLASAELYDPVTQTFSPTGSMGTPRDGHSSIRLFNGKVLIVGGTTTGGVVVNTAELYDPATGTFSPTGSMSFARDDVRSNLLDNGRVLMAGGRSTAAASSVLFLAELYDPVTGTFSQTGNMSTARADHQAIGLPNGQVLVSGGTDASGNALAAAELYSIQCCIGDLDGDGVPNEQDNAPLVYNPVQQDSDNDGKGEVVDNCPAHSNIDQLDSDGNLLGDACDDKKNVATLPGGNTAAPGAPFFVTFNIVVDNTIKDSPIIDTGIPNYLFRPDCVNIFQEVRDAANQVLPLQERYRPRTIPDDLVPYNGGEVFSVTCNIVDAVAPGSLVPGQTYKAIGFYANDFTDADIVNGVCTLQPCFDIFTGVVKSNEVSFSVLPLPPGGSPAVTVQIDIKFGAFPNSLNPDSKGVTPVTVLGSPSLNVKQINVSTLLLGGAPVSSNQKGKFQVSYSDQDGDGNLDLLAHFVTPTRQQLGLVPGQVDTLGVVTGSLTDGTPIVGVDSLLIVKN